MTPETPQTEPNRKVITARHFLETYTTTIMINGCMLVQGVILARVLGVEGRGNLAAIILWPTIIANIGLLGTNLAVTRTAATVGGDVGPIARTGILLSLILSIVAVTTGLALLPLLIPKANSDIMGLARIYMILFVPAYILSANLTGVDHGQGRFRRLNFFRLLQSPVYVLFLVILLLFGRANLTYCIWALLGALWVTALGRFALMIRQIPLFGPVASLSKLLRRGIPFLIAAIIPQFTSRGDRILLLWLLTDHDLGLYAVAFSTASLLGTVSSSIGIVSLTIAAQERPHEGFARIAKIFRASTVVSVGMGLVLAVAIYLLLPLVYGQEFSGARMTGIILAGGFILFGLTSLLAQSLTGQGKPLAGTFSRLAGMVVMVLIAYVLCRPLGVNGVALGFVAAQIVSLCGLLLLTIRHYESSSLVAMVPTYADVRLLIRQLLQNVAAALTKIGIIRSPVPQNASTSEEDTE